MEDYYRKSASKELYLLITKFLEKGPCYRTLQTLKEELKEHNIIPKRLDWEGDFHEQSVEEWLKKNSHIQGDLLLDLSLRIGPLVDKECKPSAPGIKTLLGSGNQSLLRTSKDTSRNHWRLSDYSVRRNHAPLISSSSSHSHNIVHVLHGRENCGPPVVQSSVLSNQLFCRLQLLSRTLGHLSAVYCVLFDKTGKYIVTGADDFLVKVWSAIDGRLLCSLRGSTSEITDIAVNMNNTLLAAGSLDKQIRVWCLQSGFPVATLSGHSGMITGVYFCPLNLNDSYYLVSTSSDGSVAFWNYSEQLDGSYNFPSRPVLYNEKMRPGQAQIICGSFSAGGMFLAAGSADHHVRVYCMDGEVPHRVMEMEKHSERVDSIQWAHRSLRFISGSKDGTAIIWHYKAQQWHSVHLHMSTLLPGYKVEENSSSVKLKATMVCWNSDDSRVVTAVNDYTLKVWDPCSGKLLHILKDHRDETYVVENHPFNPAIMFTAGHDGIAFLWDIMVGKQVVMFENHIEGQGNGAVFDAKWSPDGTMVAATDSHGHLLIFGLTYYSDQMKQLPRELFFHTDYRPLTRGPDGSVLDTQTQIPPHLMPPPFLVDIEGNPYPPSIQRLVPGRQFCTSDQLIPNVVFTATGGQEVIEGVSNRPQTSGSTHNTSPRSRLRRSGSVEGIRHSSGNWQKDDGFFWTQSMLVPPLNPGAVHTIENRVGSLSMVELEEYKRESERAPLVELSAEINKPAAAKKKRIHSYRTRATWDHLRQQEDGDSSSSSERETSDVTAHSDELSGKSSSSDPESSEYSDWVADHGISLEPPQRSRRRRKKPQPAPAQPTVKKKQPPLQPTPPPPEPHLVPPAPSQEPKEVAEIYRPSEWLSEVIPKKFPYYPQMGDEVMFFKKGYQLYLNAVREKNVYQLAKSQLFPWGKLNLKEPELVKVIGIKYELRPPRLCCLRLAVMKSNTDLTGDRFTIKYHDVPDVIDFLVLQHTYETAISRKWKIGDRFRSMIDDSWWWGVIEGRRVNADSHFLCHKIKWDNGEQEDMSPWDMEPVDPHREPEGGGSVPVLAEEISAILYHPRSDEWPGGGRDTACDRILSGLNHIMSLAIAEPFNAPVDINAYPSYASIVEYPVDLSLIKARFENRFYRRIVAAQFDIRYLATNAEKFNEPHSAIVKQARIVTDLCLNIMKEECMLDVNVMYRQLLETYQSSPSDSDDEDEEPSTSRSQRAAANRFLRAMRRANRDHNPDWKRDCKQLLEVLWNCKDSEPFREPVDNLRYPEYEKVIDTPLDLSTIREELRGGNYTSPLHFCRDIRMMFNNSKSFNTNKRSKIYVMTVRLSAMAEEHMKRIIQHWRGSRKGRRKLNSKKGNKRKRKTPYDDDSSGPDEESDDDFYLANVRTKGKRVTRGRGPEPRQIPQRTETVSEKDSTEPDSAQGQAENNDFSESGSEGCTVNGWKESKEESSSSSSEEDENSNDNEVDCSTSAIPRNSWSLNENGTVRILRPVRKATCPEVLEVSREVVLDEDNDETDNSDTNGDELEIVGEEQEVDEDEEKSEVECGDVNQEEEDNEEEDNEEEENEEGDIEVEDNEEENNEEENNEEDDVNDFVANGDISTNSDVEVKPVPRGPRGRGHKRIRSESSESDIYRACTSREMRPRRTVKRRTYFDDSEEESSQSKRSKTKRPQRQTRKQYRESSDSCDEPELSISFHGRVRKLRPQVRAFLKDS